MDRKMMGPWMDGGFLQETQKDANGVAGGDAEGASHDFFRQAWATQTRGWSSPIGHLSTVHDIAVIYLEGEIGIPEFHALSESIVSLKNTGFTKIILSFHYVDHLNYRVFQELMDVAKRLREISGDLRFAEINHYLYHILLFAGADQTIDSYRNVEEGILSFHNTHGRSWH